MKKVKLLHNPSAGKGETEKKELMALIRKKGFDCEYFSTKEKGWDKFKGFDFVAVAGGDGTVVKVATTLLRDGRELPIALLPSGIANNIANTLGVGGTPESIVESWKNGKTKKLDAGTSEGDAGPDFFVEGFGCGVFPELIRKMTEVDKDELRSPEEEITHALKELHEIIHFFEPIYCRIELDGVDYSGKYILVEIMNINTIGPNLALSPEVKASDGQFDVVLITEQHRQKLADTVQTKINGKKESFSWVKPVKASSVKIQFRTDQIHIDDKLVPIKSDSEFVIENRKKALSFFV